MFTTSWLQRITHNPIKQALGNRYFDTLDEIRSAIWSGFDTISPPGIYQYLCP
jgi:hypothetical protein